MKARLKLSRSHSTHTYGAYTLGSAAVDLNTCWKFTLPKDDSASRPQESTAIDLPMDWDDAFTSNPADTPAHADSIPDGLVLSLANLGRVDIGYIARISGTDCQTVVKTLKGSIYQNPETWNEDPYQGWETADEYLSGRMLHKYQAALDANVTYNGYFGDNVRAILQVLPMPVDTGEIYVTLGSPWVPPDIIDDFIEHLFGRKIWLSCRRKGRYITWQEMRERAKVKHDVTTGTWHVPEKNRYEHSIGVSSTYGTTRMEALHILEHTLNMKPVAIHDASRANPTSKTLKNVLNHSETVLAQEKQRALIEAFQGWVWRDEERTERLLGIFEDNYSCVVRRRFDGQFLTFPTMAPGAHLYPYQKDAVARIILTPNTLLAHDVGSGKTYVMAAAGMEMRRMGISKKNLYVVPNNIVGQWRQVFEDLYPQAKVLCVDPRTFKPAKRISVLEEIRDNDYDAIIIAYSCFGMIPLSASFYHKQLKAKRAELDEALDDNIRATPQVKKHREALAREIDKLATKVDSLEQEVFFEQLGITRMFVDEAHNFKNVPISTQITGVLGLSTAGSKQCQDMLNKVRVVQRANNGGGVVLATGTPITNSITEIYVMQQYLQSGELAMLGLQSFDSWVGMFAEQATGFEVDVDTSSFRMATRFSTFHNLPELTSLLACVADFHRVDESAGIPHVDERKDVKLLKTDKFEEYLQRIAVRADRVRSRRVDPKVDNMLKITNDGRQAALDLRLVEPDAPFTPRSKVARCAQNVYELFVCTEDTLGAQLVFCDTSTPKPGFNLYSELKRLLVDMGVPPEQIAFVHDAESEKARSTLFAQVRAGQVRVLVGSTFKLGLGVNVQDRLVALHHLDVPWRPADMTQREGRILRQGNTNESVEIFRYVTEGSFDAYSWQLLETKQRFISELLAGSLAERNGSDVDATALDYAEVKALAVGNPLVKERVQAANNLSRYQALQGKLTESHIAMKQELNSLPGRLEHQRERIAQCAEDAAFAATLAAAAPKATTKTGKARRQSLRGQIVRGLASNHFAESEKEFASYRGFQLVLPANMAPNTPFIWVRRTGTYRVDMGESEQGMLRRVDNCIDGLAQHLARLEQALTTLEEREASLHTELANRESYASDVEYWRNRVAAIDEMLGVER